MSRKPKIFVTRKIPYLNIEEYKDLVDIEVNEEEISLSDQSILKKISSINGLLCFSVDEVTKEVLESASNLEVICNHATDCPNIDVEEATKRGVYITCVPGELVANAVAEFTIGLIITITRKIIEANNLVVQREWRGWSPTLLMGKELKNRVLGIIGLGKIGERVAKLAKGFDMKVLYYSRTRKPLEKELSIDYVDFETLLRKSDIVTLHVALTNETFHLIGEKELGLMKKTAYLINTSRGAVVDEKALCEVLKRSRIAGAALDVFENEPISEKNPLLNLKNTLLAPHIGGATEEARLVEIEFAVSNIIKALRGELPQNLANPGVLEYKTQRECAHHRIRY